MITVIALNHSVTCFNHYIFDSTQTHAVYCMEENLKYILGNPYTISHAIEYQHNDVNFRLIEKIIKRR